MGDAESFHYLNQSYCYKLVSVIDVHDSLYIKKVMEIIGLNVKENESLLRILAYVFTFGNLKFAQGIEIDLSILEVNRYCLYPKL